MTGAECLRFPDTVTDIVLPHRAWEKPVRLTFLSDSVLESTLWAMSCLRATLGKVIRSNRRPLLGHPMSPARIRRELNALQLSILRHKATGDRYAMPGPATVDDRRILTRVGLTWNEARRPSRCPQNAPARLADTKADLPPPRKLEMIAIVNRRCSAFLRP